MAYEYTFALPDQPLAHDFAATVSCFEQRVGLTLYVVERSALGCRYAFDSTLRSNWPEDFAISTASTANSEWYVAFFSATGEQRTRILTALTVCLHGAGATSLFEEI